MADLLHEKCQARETYYLGNGVFYCKKCKMEFKKITEKEEK